MIEIRPLDVFLWTIRRNEKDVINLYDALSPIMRQATGGTMLNFGFWNQHTADPLSAQKNLCSFFGNLSELDSAKNVLDVGSGLTEPSIVWRNEHPQLSMTCVNINLKQLQFAGTLEKIEFVNSTATMLPFSNSSFDRILALESAQHFKPLTDFLDDAKRVLTKSGILALALPITMEAPSFAKLGILQFTWSSEHYPYRKVKNSIEEAGFEILEETLIGKSVYEPLANYYIENRDSIKSSILEKYPNFVESLLFKSIVKMRDVSEKKIIEYLVIKCQKP